jgi:hypothetical protein
MTVAVDDSVVGSWPFAAAPDVHLFNSYPSQLRHSQPSEMWVKVSLHARDDQKIARGVFFRLQRALHINDNTRK